MSINYSILKTLNMEDENIIFEENFVEKRKINKINSLIYKGYLKNVFQYCPICGCINDNTIIKNGTKASLIKIPKISELTSYLELKKQRYKCKNCNKRFTATTSIVDYRCHISNNTKHSIIKYAKHIIIAINHNVSNMTVQRIIDRIYDNEKLYKHYLPEVICIDEFTALKREMAFNICNAKKRESYRFIARKKSRRINKLF